MLTRSRTPKALIFATSLVSLLTRLHHAGAQTCNCSCDASIPPTFDVAAAFRNEGPGGPNSYVTACRHQTIPIVADHNAEIRHATQLSFGAAVITHFCINLKYPTGQPGDVAYAFIAALDPNNQNLPGVVLHETAFTVNVNGGHQLVQLNTPVGVSGTLWAGVRYPSARCNIGHQGVGLRNQGRAALYIGGPGGAGGGGGWMDYESTGSGFYVGKAPLIRPLTLVPASGGGGGLTGCRVIASYTTNAAGLLETTELAGSQTVSIRLSQMPTGPVMVTANSTNPAEGVTTAGPMFFDQFNWATPQSFVVQGVDDPLPDGPINYRVEFLVTSADFCYNMIAVPAIGCVNLDDETGGIYCSGKWKQTVPFGMVPATLADPSMAFDSYRNVAILFGGQPGAAGPGETWEWDGAMWKLVTMSGPISRTGHAMAFDSIRNVVVLMGGTDTFGNQLADTWEYNGVSWTQMSPGLPNAPGGPRVDHAMAFDAARGLTVLFGGDPLLGVNQAWEWNGTTWTAHPTATTPVRRSNHVMTFDARRQRVILFSGFLNNPPFVENDIWEYNGANWTPVAAGGGKPPARIDAGLVHDPVRGVSILFGGNAGGGALNDTWEWDGVAKTWNPIPSGLPMPGGRSKHAMAYDIPRRTVVVFGGDNGGGLGWTSDTWLYDPAGPIAPTTSRNFLVRGIGTGNPYSWGMTINNLPYLTISQAGFFPGLPAAGIAGALTNQINASGCGQLVANTNVFAPNVFSISTTSPAQYGLSFGSAGGMPGCNVNAFTICAFNPTITEVFLDGVDCNQNGIDDVLDIANNELLDANANGVIDTCEVVSTGDLNCDNVVNILDVQDFILALLDPAMYGVLHPVCPVTRADINADGQTDGRDVAPFVMLLGQ